MGGQASDTYMQKYYEYKSPINTCRHTCTWLHLLCSAAVVDHPTTLGVQRLHSQYAIQCPQYEGNCAVSGLCVSKRSAVAQCPRPSLQKSRIRTRRPDTVPHPRPEQERCPLWLRVGHLHMRKQPGDTQPTLCDPTKMSLWEEKGRPPALLDCTSMYQGMLACGMRACRGGASRARPQPTGTVQTSRT